MHETQPRFYAVGDKVPKTGVYRVFHGAGPLVDEVTLVQNETFPRCAVCKGNVHFSLVKLLAAVRADTISITSCEIGMFAWMALTRFVFFPEQHRIHPNVAVFWFMMQIAMIAGWATSYPANVWLLRKGRKEKMPQYPSMEIMGKHKLPSAA